MKCLGADLAGLHVIAVPRQAVGAERDDQLRRVVQQEPGHPVGYLVHGRVREMPFPVAEELDAGSVDRASAARSSASRTSPSVARVAAGSQIGPFPPLVSTTIVGSTASACDASMPPSAYVSSSGCATTPARRTLTTALLRPNASARCSRAARRTAPAAQRGRPPGRLAADRPCPG